MEHAGNKKNAKKEVRRYLLLMGGIIVGELALVFLLFLFADLSPLFFALFTLIALLTFLILYIRMKYKEKINVVAKDQVLAKYRQNARRVFFSVLLTLLGVILIRTVILILSAL